MSEFSADALYWFWAVEMGRRDCRLLDVEIKNASDPNQVIMAVQTPNGIYTLTVMEILRMAAQLRGMVVESDRNASH